MNAPCPSEIIPVYPVSTFRPRIANEVDPDQRELGRAEVGDPERHVDDDRDEKREAERRSV
jgi:hypothetical protein